MWIFHLILVIAISSLFGQITATGASEFPLFLSLMFFSLYGEMIAVTILGTSHKSFAFCLPDHMREVRKMLFTIWSLIAAVCFLILSTLYLFGVHIDPPVFITHIGLMSLGFWSGTSVYIRKIQFLLLFILLLLFSLILFEQINSTMLLFIVDNQWPTTFICGILSYLFYRATGSRTNHRRVCALPHAGFRHTSQSKRSHIDREWRYRNSGILFSRLVDFFSTFFTRRIRSKRHSELPPHLWGQLHLIITPFFSRLQLIFASFTGSYIFLIVFPSVFARLKGAEFYLFDMLMLIMCSLVFSIICTYPRFKNFLFPGRRIHFLQGIVVVFAAVILVIGFLGASILLFNLLSIIFSRTILMGKPSSVVTLPWTLLMAVPFIMVPLFGGLFVLFRGAVLMIAISAAIVISIFASFPVIVPVGNTPFTLNTLLFLSTAAVTWGFHLAALYYTGMRRSLC